MVNFTDDTHQVIVKSCHLNDLMEQIHGTLDLFNLFD